MATASDRRDLRIYWDLLAYPRDVAKLYDGVITGSLHGLRLDAKAARALDEAMTRAVERVLRGKGFGVEASW